MAAGKSEDIALAVSTVIFALHAEAPQARPSLHLPLVRRIREPFAGRWALPGGPLLPQEGLSAAAARNLQQTTGLRPGYLEQLYAFGDPDRSPSAGRMVSVVYWALVHADAVTDTSSDDNVRWFAADDLPSLAFDHNLIVEYALWRLRNKMEYSRIAHAMLGETFTLSELRQVYEAVLRKPLDPANFRRQVEASGALVATDSVVTGGRHRPPRLYRYNDAVDMTDNGPLTDIPQHPPPHAADSADLPDPTDPTALNDPTDRSNL
ncbi:NUDIX hydrolase [Ruicaihuangia caeni]|uniref:NUDIX domain-containing protein n=1 Tax=Ruicaihuangia caeni TaxID=3042517 RepID=A0AAW6T3P0_9MICO|nr:NUDIX domain-containing protein [Klugiella sp. YN-L-19]MDI2097944.1 NUDIX domain-containing protein [Klugiella sp. YN-L-19]